MDTVVPQHLSRVAQSFSRVVGWRFALASFGTWRDGLGRLIRGIDDFDYAYPLPFLNDLVRLAVSAILDASEGEIKVFEVAQFLGPDIH